MGSLSIGTQSEQLEVADWVQPTPLAGPEGLWTTWSCVLPFRRNGADVPSPQLKKWATANIPLQAICLRTQHMSVADPQLFRTVQQELSGGISVRFICRYSARAPIHCLVYLAGWALSTNRGSALAMDFVVRGNGTRCGCRPNSNVLRHRNFHLEMWLHRAYQYHALWMNTSSIPMQRIRASGRHPNFCLEMRIVEHTNAARHGRIHRPASC